MTGTSATIVGWNKRISLKWNKINNRFQTEDQEALWKQILDIVNKTNLIDYTMDIRKRLQLGDEMPQVSEFIWYTIYPVYINDNKSYITYRDFGLIRFISRNWPNAKQMCMRRLLNYKKRCHKSPKLRKFWKMPKTLRIPKHLLKKLRRNSVYVLQIQFI